MSEIEQKLVIDKQYFYQLLELINSNNEEDYSLAFQIIENMEYSNNFMYILFLFRNCISSKRELWQKVAPESYNYATYYVGQLSQYTGNNSIGVGRGSKSNKGSWADHSN